MLERGEESFGGRHDRPRSGPSAVRGHRGFTLVELLVTVAIIGIVSAIAIANLANALDKSKQRKSMATMRNLSTALQAYESDNSRFPSDSISMQQLQALLSPDLFNSVKVTDGWGYDLNYETNLSSFTLESYGDDAADGPADITYDTRFEFDYDIVMIDGIFISSPEHL